MEPFRLAGKYTKGRVRFRERSDIGRYWWKKDVGAGLVIESEDDISVPVSFDTTELPEEGTWIKFEYDMRATDEGHLYLAITTWASVAEPGSRK